MKSVRPPFSTNFLNSSCSLRTRSPTTASYQLMSDPRMRKSLEALFGNLLDFGDHFGAIFPVIPSLPATSSRTLLFFIFRMPPRPMTPQSSSRATRLKTHITSRMFPPNMLTSLPLRSEENKTIRTRKMRFLGMLIQRRYR